MNGKLRVSCMLLASCIVCMPMLHAKIVGSTTAVSLEPAITFPSSDIDNLIQGFAWLKNGFTLEDSLTTCTFNGLYPVSGTVALSQGTLNLAQDLLCKNSTLFASLGTIYGNTYSIDLCSSVSALPRGNCVLYDASVFLHNDLDIQSSITIGGTCIIQANDAVITFADSGSITIAPGAHLIVSRADLQGLSGTQIICADDTASLELNNVIIEQDGDFIFQQGSILFKNEVDIIGSYTFMYDSNCTSTIDDYSSLHVTDGMTLQIGRKAAVNYNEPLAFIDQTSRLVLDNCDLHVTATGICLTKGNVVFKSNVNCYIDATDKDHGIILGNGNSDDDVNFYYSPGCEVKIYKGAFTYRNGSPYHIKTSARDSRLSRTEQSYIYIDTDCLVDGMTIDLVSDYVPAMQVAAGATLSYNNATVIANGVEFLLTATQIAEYSYCLGGNQLLSLTKGILPAYLEISGPGNVFEGTGSISGIINFQENTNAELLWQSDGYLINNLNMNGGTIVLQSKMNFCANGAFTGPGTVNLGMASLVLCEKESQLVPPVCFIGSTGSVVFNEKLSLSSTCTFQGYCIVNGSNGVLALGNDAELIIADNSTLKLRDMTILGVNGKNIRCLSDSGTLELNNVRLVLDGDYTFDAGNMLFMNTVSFSGSYTFAYASQLTSTIDSYATLQFDHGITCSLSRAQLTDAVGPFVCQDSTAAFSFDDSTLYVHTNGVKFTKGSVYCNRNFTIDIISTSSTNGLIVGDGTPDGDMIFQFMPGASVIYPRGHMVYNVTRPDGLRSNSNTASIIRYDDSTVYLRHNCTISNLIIQTTPYALFVPDDGVVLSYDNGVIKIPQGALEMTGERSSTYANILRGNDSLLLTKGSLPMSTLVYGANNTLSGNGNVLGAVTLYPGASLIWSLNGTMLNDILLAGGDLTLTTDLNFTDTYFVTGPGTVHMNGKQILTGESDIVATTSLYWDGSTILTGCIELQEDLILSALWTFSGNVCLNGGGNMIDLGDTGSLLIEKGSTLILENATVNNVSGGNIHCAGDTSRLILNNVKIIQSGNFIFDTGSFEVAGDALLSGFGTTFAYCSTQTSLVDSNSRLLLDQGLTFSYDPLTPASDLIQFADDTAQLVLQGSTLHSTSTVGWQLTKGYLNIKKDSYLSSDVIVQNGESIDAGITIGDGTIENDLYCEFVADAEVHMLAGSLNYKNASLNSWYMHDYTSRLYMDSKTIFRLYQNLDLGNGYLFYGDGVTLESAPGKSITGATGQLGAFYTENLP